jgi:hypothetical protein
MFFAPVVVESTEGECLMTNSTSDILKATVSVNRSHTAGRPL